MAKFKQILFFFVFLMCFWLLLTGFNFNDQLIPGIAISLIIAVLFSKASFVITRKNISPKVILYIFIYPFVFFGELLKANFDVAFRVVQPVIPINPGIVKVKTNLKSSLGRLILANSITLTPGTLTVDTEGEYLYIHWIDVSGDDIDETTRTVTGKFEKYLEVIFG